MPATTYYALIMLLAGIGVPVLAALNAALGTWLGSPFAAGLVLFSVALVTAFISLLLFSNIKALSGVSTAPRHLFLAGTLVAFYVLSITAIAPHFGVGNAVFFVLLGQLISAGLIDHFGLFGARPSPISMTRAAGIMLMAAGVFLTQKV